RQDPVVVAVIGIALPRPRPGVALAPRLRHGRSEGALRLALLVGPVEAVVLAFAARDLLGVAVERSLLGVHLEVVALRVDVRASDLDRGELVPPDPPIEELLLAQIGRAH